MKQLLIANERAILDDNQYFPFTHELSDLENINVLKMPSSKTVTIPRCPQNDRIFGYIGEITRINLGAEDNQVGVLFNQTKKCEYILLDDSEQLSKGLVLIDNITEDYYEITLYDYLIKKLEDLEGDEDTEEYYLTSCELPVSGSTLLDIKSTAENINLMNNGLYSALKPIICIKDSDALDGGTIRCLVAESSGDTAAMANYDLPTDCSSLQLRTLKNWEVNYAVPINNVVEAINYTYPNTLVVDNELIPMFNEVNMLCKSPVNDDISETINLTSYTVSGTTQPVQILVNNYSTGINSCVSNGHKYFDLMIEAKWIGDTTKVIGGRLPDGFAVMDPKYYTDAPDGTVFSYKWAKVWLTNGGKATSPVYYKIEFIKGQNVTLHYAEVNPPNTFITGITVITELIIDLDFYPQLGSDSDTSTYINISFQEYDPANAGIKWKLMDGMDNVHQNYVKLLPTSTLTESSLDFRTNDMITTKKIFPKVSIKSFIVNLTKFFNLDLAIEDSKLKIQPKKYYLTDEVLLIDSIEGIATNNITFDKLVLTTALPDSDILDTYKNRKKKIYGEQVINTGYSIKKNKKEIKLEAAVPFMLKDYNSFAYDRFCNYRNAGYAKNNHGVITGLDDKLVFGYLGNIVEDIYITNDSPCEAGMNTTTTSGATEVKFVHYNPLIKVVSYDSLTSDAKWEILDKTHTDVVKLLNYYTFSPYIYTGDNITKSLEMNKPIVNYAGIKNINYPDTSTLYYKFHRNMLIDKYDSNTHILSVKAYVDKPLDVSKIYNYKNSYYIISSIVEYDPTQPGIYELKLMRVNNPNNYINNLVNV